ncbi:MAG: macro domain-containing protein [Pseudomonadota bacterium]
MPRIEIVTGPIEQLEVDAVVNAANRRLLPGAGVDGAIRRAAGPELTRLTNSLQPIEEGGVVLTPGFEAKPRWIIHTAAPVWYGAGDEVQKEAGLSACYRNALALAEAEGFASIAFPCIGTGIYGWPKERA